MSADSGLEVRMPRLSESMSEGTIVRWLHASGAEVERGDELAEIETDKAMVSFEADAGGILEILAEEGATLPVGAVIARVGGTVGGTAAATGAVQQAAAPAAPAAAVTADPAPATPPSVRRIPTSPLARRRAKELGVDLADVQGTGPGGRIVRADIEAVASARKPEGAAANGAAPPTLAPAGAPLSTVDTRPAPAAVARENGADLRGPVTVVPLSRARQLTADRMSESARTVPSFPLTAEADMTRALELRAGIAELGEGTVVPTVTDLVVAACGRALREHPRVNASYREGTVAMFGRVNIGVAVNATDALLVPTITDVDARSLTSIAVRTRELADLARGGQIGPADLEGATFTVSNLGMFGVTVFEAVINPPQAAILAVGALRRLPREVGGELHARPILTLTLTSDHRVLDGAESARFLRRLVELLERPLALLLDHPTTSEESA
ncbi:dihydrolipoamide acetyltransferase family protein [Pseudonocardia alaniniphila]|uniref:Dihydrolipoamide acetyltransferase component of pyruvate dehydrogenase complex n=1 Tax=Pseudonocardia alaniniphila TaxID=75291 RepID=A0ABS9T7F5_9PSEU|nr:dihydrolipoamide acetyltransferase family protein [Pseudonocardia alaniniphila]MCH6164464.1 2-oxo acid dehydrogenase subunit E2 [Pseudonocardia alaniniphila]